MVSPGVTGKILSLVLAAVLVTAVCSTIFIVQTRANIEDQVFVDQAELGQAYARAVHEYLSGSQSVVETVTRMPAVRAPLHPELNQPALRGIPETADAERRASLRAMIDGSGRVAGMVMASASGAVYLMEPYPGQIHFPLQNLRDQNPELSTID